MLSLNLREVGDSILGTHCFVVQEGEKIDCCLEDDGMALRLKRVADATFEGVFKSCYDDKERKIKVTISESSINFMIIQGTHPFIPESLKFYPVKSH